MSAKIEKSPAYLRGLIEGLGIDASSDTGRIFLGMLDVINALNRRIDRLERGQTELRGSLKKASETLEDLDDLCDLMMRDMIGLKTDSADLADDDFDDLPVGKDSGGYLSYHNSFDEDDEDDFDKDEFDDDDDDDED